MVQKKQKLTLKITEFGDERLRQKARPLKKEEIKSAEFIGFVKRLKEKLIKEKLGVGLAAAQVGDSRSVAIVRIRPKEHREKAKKFDMELINPQIIKTFGYRKQMWEGCISGASSVKGGLFAKVPRYKKIRIKFMDMNAKGHTKDFEGLPAQVIQHEIDHLNGVLFVDRVKDTTSYVTYNQYLKMAKEQQNDKKRR